jgi:hypothetical protein
MSAELRAYSLSAFLAATCLLVAFRLCDGGSRRGAGYALLTALLVLLVYSTLRGW